MERHTLRIGNMKSPHCVMTVRNLIDNQGGIQLETIEPGKVEVSINEAKSSLAALVAAIENMGYKVEDKN